MFGRFDKLLNEGESSKTLSQLYRKNRINPDTSAICLAMDGIGVRWEIPRTYDNFSLKEAELEVATQEAKKIGRTIADKSSSTTTFIHHYELRRRTPISKSEEKKRISQSILARDIEIKSMQSHKQKLGQLSLLTHESKFSKEIKTDSLLQETPDEITPNLFLGNGTCDDQYLASLIKRKKGK